MSHYKIVNTTTQTGAPALPADPFVNRSQPGLLPGLLQDVTSPGAISAVSEFGVRTMFEDLKNKIYINALNLSGHSIDNGNSVSGIVGNIQSVDINANILNYRTYTAASDAASQARVTIENIDNSLLMSYNGRNTIPWNRRKRLNTQLEGGSNQIFSFFNHSSFDNINHGSNIGKLSGDAFSADGQISYYFAEGLTNPNANMDIYVGDHCPGTSGCLLAIAKIGVRIGLENAWGYGTEGQKITVGIKDKNNDSISDVLGYFYTASSGDIINGSVDRGSPGEWRTFYYEGDLAQYGYQLFDRSVVVCVSANDLKFAREYGSNFNSIDPVGNILGGFELRVFFDKICEEPIPVSAAFDVSMLPNDSKYALTDVGINFEVYPTFAGKLTSPVTTSTAGTGFITGHPFSEFDLTLAANEPKYLFSGWMEYIQPFAGTLTSITESRDSNIATITVNQPHNLMVGDHVRIQGFKDDVGIAFNDLNTDDALVLSVPYNDTFTFANVGTNWPLQSSETGRITVIPRKSTANFDDPGYYDTIYNIGCTSATIQGNVACGFKTYWRDKNGGSIMPYTEDSLTAYYYEPRNAETYSYFCDFFKTSGTVSFRTPVLDITFDKMENKSFIDSSFRKKTVLNNCSTPPGPTSGVIQEQYHGSLIGTFDGSSWLQISNDVNYVDFDFSLDDGMIDVYFMITQGCLTTYAPLLTNGISNIVYVKADGSVNLSGATGDILSTETGLVQDSQWYHLTVVRTGQMTNMLLNGTIVFDGDSKGVWPTWTSSPTTALMIGAANINGTFMCLTGHMEDVVISKSLPDLRTSYYYYGYGSTTPTSAIPSTGYVWCGCWEVDDINGYRQGCWQFDDAAVQDDVNIRPPEPKTREDFDPTLSGYGGPINWKDVYVQRPTTFVSQLADTPATHFTKIRLDGVQKLVDGDLVSVSGFTGPSSGFNTTAPVRITVVPHPTFNSTTCARDALGIATIQFSSFTLTPGTAVTIEGFTGSHEVFNTHSATIISADSTSFTYDTYNLDGVISPSADTNGRVAAIQTVTYFSYPNVNSYSSSSQPGIVTLQSSNVLPIGPMASYCVHPFDIYGFTSVSSWFNPVNIPVIQCEERDKGYLFGQLGMPEVGYWDGASISRNSVMPNKATDMFSNKSQCSLWRLSFPNVGWTGDQFWVAGGASNAGHYHNTYFFNSTDKTWACGPLLAKNTGGDVIWGGNGTAYTKAASADPSTGLRCPDKYYPLIIGGNTEGSISKAVQCLETHSNTLFVVANGLNIPTNKICYTQTAEVTGDLFMLGGCQSDTGLNFTNADKIIKVSVNEASEGTITFPSYVLGLTLGVHIRDGAAAGTMITSGLLDTASAPSGIILSACSRQSAGTTNFKPADNCIKINVSTGAVDVQPFGASWSNYLRNAAKGNLFKPGATIKDGKFVIAGSQWVKNKNYVTYADIIGVSFQTVSRGRSSNVTTIVTTRNHGFSSGDTINIAGLGDESFNGNDLVLITGTTGAILKFNNPGYNVGTIKDSGGYVTASDNTQMSYDNLTFVTSEITTDYRIRSNGITYDQCKSVTFG